MLQHCAAGLYPISCLFALVKHGGRVEGQDEMCAMASHDKRRMRVNREGVACLNTVAITHREIVPLNISTQVIR